MMRRNSLWLEVGAKGVWKWLPKPIPCPTPPTPHWLSSHSGNGGDGTLALALCALMPTKSSRCSSKRFPDARHDILDETVHRDVSAAVVDFIEAQALR